MYKPLTPKFRDEIITGINAQRMELNTCQQTAYISVRKIGLDALEAGKNKVYEGKTILEVMKEIVEEQPGIEMQEAKAAAGSSAK